MTVRNPFDTSAKRIVREQWNTPLLRRLHQDHGFRFRYMGLPGVDLLDINAWRDMIEEVVAFEVRASQTKDDPDGRRNIVELRRNLNLLEIPGRAFFGPMEEVIILRQDYDGQPYNPKEVITLYNLDFCDEISSRIDTREGKKVWRFEAIRQILTDQKIAYQDRGGPGVFVLLLTVRDQIDSRKLRNFLSEGLYDDTKAYLEICGGAESLPESGFVLGNFTWALKAFIHNTLRQYFANPHISAAFFPLVQYRGTPIRHARGSIQSPMLHSMVICCFEDSENPYPSYMPGDFLSCVSSIAVKDENSLVWCPQPGEPTSHVGEPSLSTIIEELGFLLPNVPPR
ncbi:MAG: hypothetical protein OXD50_01105 [Chloroflexi bacterium]|nr:hypothetical protein [Chloroflexota bacterium]